MKVTVIKDSVIHRQTIHKTGDSFEVSDEIAVSLFERGYVSIEGGEEVAKALEEKGIDTLNIPFEKDQLESMERADIVQLAKDLGLKASGKTSEIIERILEFHADEEIEEMSDMPNTGMPE